jgi:hypothetical protein
MTENQKVKKGQQALVKWKELQSHAADVFAHKNNSEDTAGQRYDGNLNDLEIAQYNLVCWIMNSAKQPSLYDC